MHRISHVSVNEGSCFAVSHQENPESVSASSEAVNHEECRVVRSFDSKLETLAVDLFQRDGSSASVPDDLEDEPRDDHVDVHVHRRPEKLGAAAQIYYVTVPVSLPEEQGWLIGRTGRVQFGVTTRTVPIECDKPAKTIGATRFWPRPSLHRGEDTTEIARGTVCVRVRCRGESTIKG